RFTVGRRLALDMAAPALRKLGGGRRLCLRLAGGTLPAPTRGTAGGGRGDGFPANRDNLHRPTNAAGIDASFPRRTETRARSPTGTSRPRSVPAWLSPRWRSRARTDRPHKPVAGADVPGVALRSSSPPRSSVGGPGAEARPVVPPIRGRLGLSRRDGQSRGR